MSVLNAHKFNAIEKWAAIMKTRRSGSRQALQRIAGGGGGGMRMRKRDRRISNRAASTSASKSRASSASPS